MATDLSELLTELSISCTSESTKDEKLQLKSQLSALLNALPDDLEASDCVHTSTATSESLVGGALSTAIQQALNSSDEPTQVTAAEVIAKIAKCESCRCSSEMVSLVPALMAMQKTGTTVNSVLHATRALGNICYEHDAGRVAVIECGGVETITGLLQRALDWNTAPDDTNEGATATVPGEEEEELGKYDDVHELRLVITGFLLNLTNSCDNITGSVCTTDVVSALSHYLERHCDEEDIPTHTLLALACMADSAAGREVLSAVDLSPQIVLLLTHNLNPDVLEACLELTTTLAELDSCKLQFANGGVCDAVIDVVKRYVVSAVASTSAGAESSEPVEGAAAAVGEAKAVDTSVDSSDCNTDFCWQAIIQTATDLLVLILLGDASMPIIYADGKGPVFLQLVSWLRSDVELLQVPAALAMGNFARTDAQSMSLVALGVSQSLLVLLRHHTHKDGRIVVQHAVLAALRNLTIAQANKRALINQGALQVLLPLALTVESYPVVFKLLATMRMLIDGNTDAAVMVGTCVPVMQKVLQWCMVDEHPGVKGEASRLLAWIIKNAIAGNGTLASTTPSVEDAGQQGATPSNNAPSEVSVNANSVCDSKDADELSEVSDKEGNSNVVAVDNDGSLKDSTCSKVDESAIGGETIGIPVGVAVLHSLVEAGCLAPMLDMLQSEYPVMIHEASLAVSLCTSVCRNLPNVLENVSATALAKGVANAASKTAVATSALEASSAADDASTAAADETSAAVFSHAMYNLLVACLAIADVEGGMSVLLAANVTPHFTPLAASSHPYLKMAATALLNKLQVAA